MCFYVTIAVPSDAAEDVRRRHSERGMLVEPTENPSARGAAGPGLSPLLVTGGGCSCGWYRRPISAGLSEKRRRAEARYRRLGWGRAKIDRALASMRDRSQPDDGLHPVIQELLALLADEHGRVSVWVHDFTGKVETEAYAVSDRMECTTASLAAQALQLDTDTVLTVTPGR